MTNATIASRISSHHLPALIVPIRADSRPCFEARAIGRVYDASATHVSLSFGFLTVPLTGDLVLGVEGADSLLRWAGVTTETVTTLAGETRVCCRFGGCGEILLQADTLTSRFDPGTRRYVQGLPTAILDDWACLGVLRSRPSGVAVTCPACASIPAFRYGCPACACSLLTKTELLHHLRCGHTSRLDNGRGQRFLYCAACNSFDLASTLGFEWQTGYACAACGWVGAERALFASCRSCDNFFPAAHAVRRPIPGYEVNRFDPLAASQTARAQT